jgi:hypothetical protein
MLSPTSTLTLTRKPQSCPENVVGCGLLCLARNQLKVFMRGLYPRIHAVAGAASARREDKDGRIKPAMTTLTCAFASATMANFPRKPPRKRKREGQGA